MRIFKRKIYNRKDGIYYEGKNWYIEYTDYNGEKIRKVVGSNKKEAEDVLAKIRTELVEKGYFDIQKDSKITFNEAAKEYFEFSRNNKRSYRRDALSLKHLCNEFGDKFLYSITPQMIEEYKVKRCNLVKKSTVNRELSCLRHLFNKFIAWEKVRDNPMKKVKLFKEDQHRIRYLETEEIDRLYSKCLPSLLPVVITALNTGMRKGEILKLKRQDIDFKTGIIYVEYTKSGERREIPMNNLLTTTLRDVIKSNKDSEYVFCHKNGKPYYDVRKSFVRVLKEAGITNFRFHDLRHTFASHLVMNGIDLVTVKELMGHKTMEMTLRYAHLSPDHKKLAVESLCKKKRGQKRPSK